MKSNTYPLLNLKLISLLKGRLYLEDPAHQERPARAQLPSVRTLPGEFLLCPGGGDVTQRWEQRGTGPGTDRQKASVRKQKINLL